MPKPRNAGGFLHNLPDAPKPPERPGRSALFKSGPCAPALADPAPDLERILCATCHVRDTWVPIGSVEAYTCPRCTLILSSKASADPVQWTGEMTTRVKAASIAAARARHRAKVKATRAEARRAKGTRA